MGQDRPKCKESQEEPSTPRQKILKKSLDVDQHKFWFLEA